jgi:purine-cytosine permease-like protein
MAEKKSFHVQHLTETHQSVWDLTSIQLAGWTSLPILVTSLLILETNSVLGTMLTIVVGNAILWFIRLGIIAMSHEKRKSTLDLARDYMGSFGGYFIAVLLLISTLVWFIAQTTAASKTLTFLISIDEGSQIDQFTQVSVFLGIVSAFLCMNGVSVLRKLCTYSFPFLILGFFAILYLLPDLSLKENGNPLSLSGLSLVLASNLGITSDMPTFFRHSKSWDTSIKALTLIQIISLALGLCSLYFSAIINQHFEIHKQLLMVNQSLISGILIFFIFVSVLCANVANVYSASVGWELIAPKALIGRKEYLILGLSLTTIFILVFDLFPLESVLNASDSSLVNLCVILVIGHVITAYQKRPTALFEKTTYFIAWLLATSLDVIHLVSPGLLMISSLSVNVSVIIGVVFVAFLGKQLTSYFKKSLKYC